MAERGDVLRLKRRLGFGAKGEAESVVVVQANQLNAVLPTLLVVPLDPATGAYGHHPAVLRVSRDEAGSRVDQVAVPWRLRPSAPMRLRLVQSVASVPLRFEHWKT